MYEKISGKPIEKVFGDEAPCMREAVRCLNLPPKYFADLAIEAFKEGAHKQTKAALTMVVVSHSDTNMEEIKEAYLKHHGTKLVEIVAKNTHSHYRDALLAMISK